MSSDTLAMSGDTLAMSGDTLTMSGDTLTMLSNTLTMLGNTLTMSGDTLTMSGDTLTRISHQFLQPQSRVLTGRFTDILESFTNISLNPPLLFVKNAELKISGDTLVLKMSLILNFVHLHRTRRVL